MKLNDQIPELTYDLDGFVNGEDINVIDELPIVALEQNVINEIGEYNIVISGGHDDSYDFEYVNGILSVKLITDLSEPDGTELLMYPNPVRTTAIIESKTTPINSVLIKSITGSLIHTEEGINSPTYFLETSNLAFGTYIVDVILSSSEQVRLKLLVK